jgi:hypothetical protein
VGDIGEERRYLEVLPVVEPDRSEPQPAPVNPPPRKQPEPEPQR